MRSNHNIFVAITLAIIWMGLAHNAHSESVDGAPKYVSQRDINAMESLLRSRQTKSSGIHIETVGGVEFNNFPQVRLFTIVSDNQGRHKPGIPQGNFSITEARQGVVQNVTSLTVNELGAGAFSKADIVFVIDESGSMRGEFDSIRAGVKEFAQMLAGSGVDFRLALVSYEGRGDGGIGNGFSSGGFTDDPDVFENWVDQITIQGGYERAYDAIVFATSPPFEFRPDAQQVVCLITDERNDSGRYTILDVQQSLRGKQFVYFTTARSADPEHLIDADFGPLGIKLGGAFTPQTMLDSLGSLIIERYQISYTSPWPDIDGILRTVTINVEDPDHPVNIAETSVEYTPMEGGELLGRIRNQSTGNPVPGATVTIFGGPTTVTDGMGDYELEDVIASSGHSLVVDADNFKRRIVRGINVMAGLNPPIDIDIEPRFGDSVVLPLVGVNAIVGNRPTVEKGGAFLRWYRGTDAARELEARPDVEVSVFRRNLSNKQGWVEVVQGQPSERPGTALQKMFGHFPVRAPVGQAKVGDIIEFQVFYPPIPSYSPDVSPIDMFQCEVVDRHYAHGFENKNTASVGVEVILGLSPSIEAGRDLVFERRVGEAMGYQDSIVLAKKFAAGLDKGVGTTAGASLSVNNNHFGASAQASAGLQSSLGIENVYQYDALDTSIASAIAKLYLYYSPPSPEFVGALDPFLIQFLAWASREVETSAIRNPWLMSRVSLAGRGYANASATAGLPGHQATAGGSASIGANIYGEIATGAYMRDLQPFVDVEIGAGWSGGVNAMARVLTPIAGRGPDGRLLDGLAIAGDLSRSDLVFARARRLDSEIVLSFGLRSRAGANYSASFYHMASSASTAINQLIVSDFRISADPDQLRKFIDSQPTLTMLLDGNGIDVQEMLFSDLLGVVIHAINVPALRVAYERRVAAYDEIDALDVSLAVGIAKAGISGSYAGEFNRHTEFVSERGAWHLGSVYVFEDYASDADYHLAGLGSSSLIPLNTNNVSNIEGGPQDWVDTIASRLIGVFDQLIENIQSGVETIIEYGGTVISIGVDALAGAVDAAGNFIDSITVTIVDAIDSLNPFTKGGAGGASFGIGGFYVMEPDGVLLQTPSSIQIAYTDEEVAGLNELLLAVYRYDRGSERWTHVGGVVDPVNNTVTASIDILGTYTLAVPFPYHDITVTLDPIAIEADGVATSFVQTDPIRLNTGDPLPDGTLVTVASTLGTILEVDADPGMPGIQRPTSGGVVEFTVRSPEYGGVAIVSVSSVGGYAQGHSSLEFVDTTPPDMPGTIIAMPRETTIDVSWAPSEAEDVTEYRIYFSEGIPGPPYDGRAGAEGINSPVSVSALSTNGVLRGLTKNRPYYITVTAVDASGNESEMPPHIVVRTSEWPPRQVPLVMAEVRPDRDRTAEITWLPSPDDLQGAQDVSSYEVRRVNVETGEDVALGTTASGNLVYVDSPANNAAHPLNPAMENVYYIRTFDQSGNYSDSQLVALQRMGVILDVTDDVSITYDNWELDRSTGAMIATVTMRNDGGKGGIPLELAFWFAIEDHPDIFLANPAGETETGLVYADVTDQVEAQLPSIGNGDMKLDVGEEVTFQVAIYTRDRTIPQGRFYAIWADPPITEEFKHRFDANADGVIDDFEVLEAVDAWTAGELDDFGLLETIELWRAGGYEWDDSQGRFVPLP